MDIQKQVEAFRSSDADLMQETSKNQKDSSLFDSSSQPKNVRTINAVSAKDKTDNSTAINISKPFRFIPLTMGGGGRTHKPSTQSRDLILNEVTLQDLTVMTEKFYELAFEDKTLDRFIRSHSDPHGDRFAKWIHQKLSASNVWDSDRATRSQHPVRVAGGRSVVVDDRTSAHVAAWHSPKRPSEEVGRRFQLDECRVWMRLHFWALRESGMIEKSPSFADYYVRFIAHFVRVYESSAPAFARDSLRWSANPANIQLYLANGREMKDVLGLSMNESVDQIPESEWNDMWEDNAWPYNRETASPQPSWTPLPEKE